MSSGKVFPTLVGEDSWNETHSGMILDPFVSVKHCLSASDTHLFAIWTSTGLASDSTPSQGNAKPLQSHLGAKRAPRPWADVLTVTAGLFQTENVHQE